MEEALYLVDRGWVDVSERGEKWPNQEKELNGVGRRKGKAEVCEKSEK